MGFELATPLCILRFDHRAPFVRGLFGIEETRQPTAAERAQIVDLKRLIYEGLVTMLEGPRAPERRAVVAVVDEEYGAAVAHDAHAEGIPVALAVERSGQDEFEFEYGDDFAAHLERFAPEFAKALARYNPGRDPKGNARQRDRLAELSRWASAHHCPLMIELLVPPTPEQLAAVGGDERAFEREVLFDLVTETVDAFSDAGIAATIWMLPGFASPLACTRAAAHLRRQAGDDVRCTVLGQGPDPGRVTDWIRVAGEAEGYDGLAVAQTVWMPALRAYRSGASGRPEARAAIAANLRSAIAAFGPPDGGPAAGP